MKKTGFRDDRCFNCGGTKFVRAVDNDGCEYLGCARCVISFEPKPMRTK